MAKKRSYPLITDFDTIPTEALVPEDEQPYEIPSHWRWVYLGALTEVISGGTPRTSNADFYGGDIPWITPKDMASHTAMHISGGAKSLTQQGLEKSSARLLPPGSVCLSSRAPIGYVAIAEKTLSTNQGLKSFAPSPFICSEFLYWYLRAHTRLLESLASGTTFLELSASRAKQIPFPLPPLEEQERIATHLQEVDQKTGAANEVLSATIKNLRATREHLLTYALSGRASAHLDFNTPNSLLADLPTSAFVPEDEQPYEIPSHWRWVRLGTVLTERNQRTLDLTDATSYIGLEHLLPGGGVKPAGKAGGLKSQKTMFHKGDFLFGKLRPYLDKRTVVNIDGVCSTDILAFSVGDHASAHFVNAWCATPHFKEILARTFTGDRPRTNAKKLGAVPFPLPPLKEQECIDEWIARRHEDLDAVMHAADHVHHSLTTFKTTLIMQAFHGVTCPQVPHSSARPIPRNHNEKPDSEQHILSFNPNASRQSSSQA